MDTHDSMSYDEMTKELRYRCARCGTNSRSCERCPKCLRMLCSDCRKPYYDKTPKHKCEVDQ